MRKLMFTAALTLAFASSLGALSVATAVEIPTAIYTDPMPDPAHSARMDGCALSPPDEPSRPGADAPEVLHALGFDIEACQAMLAAGSVGRTDWSHLAST